MKFTLNIFLLLFLLRICSIVHNSYVVFGKRRRNPYTRVEEGPAGIKRIQVFTSILSLGFGIPFTGIIQLL